MKLIKVITEGKEHYFEENLKSLKKYMLPTKR